MAMPPLALPTRHQQLKLLLLLLLLLLPQPLIYRDRRRRRYWGSVHGIVSKPPHPHRRSNSGRSRRVVMSALESLDIMHQARRSSGDGACGASGGTSSSIGRSGVWMCRRYNRLVQPELMMQTGDQAHGTGVGVQLQRIIMASENRVA